MRLPRFSPATTSEAVPASAATLTGLQVTRGALALLSTQPLTWGASLATAILLPGFLGADGLGRFAIAMTIGMFIGTLASLGLPGFLMRRVAIEPGRAASYEWGAVAIVTLAWLALALCSLTFIAVLGSPAIDPELVSIAIVGALAAAVQAVLTAVLNGLGRHARFAWSMAGTSVVGTAAGLGALALGTGVLGYAVALVVSLAVCTALLWATSGLGFTRGAIDPSFLRQLAVGGVPFLGWNIAVRVRADIGVVLTGILLQASAAGWLAAAYRIINVAVFIPTVITTPLLPALSRSKTEPTVYRSVLGESLAIVLFLTVPISAGIFALAPAIPTLLGWPDTLEAAVPLMVVLSFQQTLVGVDMVLGTSLIALGLERRWLGVAVAAAIFNPLLNLLTIPLAATLTGNGAIGAALAELATEVVFLAGAIRLTPRHLLGLDTLINAARIVTSGIVMLAVTVLLRPYGLLLALICGGVAYLCAAAAVGAIGRRHLRVVRVALRLA